MNAQQANRLAFRVGPFTTALGCLTALFWSVIPSGYAVSRFGSPLTDTWPQSLTNPVAPTLVMVGLVLLSLIVLVVPTPRLRKIWATASLFGIGFCSLHVVTLNKAEFFGGLCAAVWWYWFVSTEASEPARLRQDGPRLATFVFMGAFLPSALGKTVPFHSPLLQLRSYGLPPLVLDTGIPESMRTAVMWMVVGIEGFVGLAPLLPLRVALWSVPVVITGMLLWDMYLLPALLPVSGVAAANLILLRWTDEP